MTDWTALLETAGGAVRRRAPASEAAIRDAEEQLGHPLPGQLASLLAETDGFYDLDARYEPCWSLQRVVDENQRVRREALLPGASHALCFGDNGAGEPFLHRRTERGWDEAVLVWNWIDGAARVLAPSLSIFWAGWCSGDIKS